MRTIPGTINEHPGVRAPNSVEDLKRASRDRAFGLPVTKIIDARTLEDDIERLANELGLDPTKPLPTPLSPPSALQGTDRGKLASLKFDQEKQEGLR